MIASCTSASVWNLWPPRCFFREPKNWTSRLDVRDTPLPNCCKVCRLLGWVGSWYQVTFISSDLWRASRWSQTSNWCGSWEHRLTVVRSQSPEFSAEGKIRWQTRRDKCLNVQGDYVKNQLTLLLSREKSNFVPKIPNQYIFRTYSYFPIDPLMSPSYWVLARQNTVFSHLVFITCADRPAFTRAIRRDQAICAANDRAQVTQQFRH